MLDRKFDIISDLEKDSLNHNPKFYQKSLESLYEYVVSRQLIHNRRSVGLPRSDWYEHLPSIFQIYKFTNLKREDDRVSKWLIDNISTNDHYSNSEKFWRSLVFRLYNRIDTAQELRLLDENLWLRDDTENEHLASGIRHDFFTRAFKVLAMKIQTSKFVPEGLNYRLGPLYFVKDLRKQFYDCLDLFGSYSEEISIYPLVSNTSFNTAWSALDHYEWFRSFSGIGSFFAYQLFVDMTYIQDFPVSENHFVVAGPGCHWGLNRLVSDWDGLDYEGMLYYLTYNLERIFQEQVDSSFSCLKLFSSYPKEDRRFNVMSLENIFCEFSKYMTVLDGGKVRKYHSYHN